MSDPTRYSAAGTKIVETDPAGPLVEYVDYEILKAEVERLTWLQVETLNERNKAEAEVERLDALCKQLMVQHSDISCENIRLRNAGDAMAEAFNLKYPVAGGLINAWLAAKEGKQP